MGFGITWTCVGILALHFLAGAASWSPCVLTCKVSMATARSRTVGSTEEVV